MAKIVRDIELLNIISGVVTRAGARHRIDYEAFVRDLADAVCRHLGGRVVASSRDRKDGLGVCVHLAWDENVPKGGGVWKSVDPDLTPADWRREAESRTPEKPAGQ